MKKLKLIVAVSVLVLLSMACAANSGNQNSGQPSDNNDSIIKAALGDSIFNIIKNAKSISADLIDYYDSTENTVKLSADQLKIMKFLLSNPQNVATNDTVYGKMLPNVAFKFSYKKQQCTLFFDFGLGKWQVKNEKDSILKTFDIKSPEFAHLSSQLFPDDKFLYLIINK